MFFSNYSALSQFNSQAWPKISKGIVVKFCLPKTLKGKVGSWNGTFGRHVLVSKDLFKELAQYGEQDTDMST